MVFNWKEHIDNCISKNKMLFSFHATAMEKHYQRWLLVKRFKELGKTDNYIFEWFKKHDKEYDIVADDMDQMIEHANKIKWPKERDYTIYITEKELSVINGLDLPKELRSYLFGIVVIAKVMKIKKGLATINARERSYAWYLVSGMDNYSRENDMHHKLQKCFYDLTKQKIFATTSYTRKIKKPDGYHTCEIINTVIKADWLQLKAKEGYKIENFETDTKKRCKELIKENFATCPRCGKRFIKSPKAKTHLCHDCYGKYRKENKKLYIRKKRQSQRDKEWTIYKHVNKINGKTYVGQTSLPVEQRWGINGEGYKEQKLFYSDIEKYGWDNFEHIILEEHIKTQYEADQKEIFYIKQLRTNVGLLIISPCKRRGYNLNGGGVKTRVLNPWTDEEHMLLYAIYQSYYPYKEGGVKKQLIENFPYRDYKEVYNRARSLGLAQEYACRCQVMKDTMCSWEDTIPEYESLK